MYGPPADNSFPPVPAPVGRRALAWAIDFALVLAVAVVLGTWTFHRITAGAVGVTA